MVKVRPDGSFETRDSNIRSTDLPRNVLVVDDDPAMLKWLNRSLKGLGYEVLTAADRNSAERVLVNAPVDAMIVDLHLGEQSGVDLLAFVRGNVTLSRMPILMLTGETQMTEDEEDAIRRHRAYVFYKPAPATELAETLEKALVTSR